MTVAFVWGAADQEIHVRVGGGASLAYQVARALAVLVGAVAAGLFHVGGNEGVKHPGVRPLLVITGKVRQRVGRIHADIIPRKASDSCRNTTRRFYPSRTAIILTGSG